MTKVIALHGDWASGERLRKDMEDPDWVDLYLDWQYQNVIHCISDCPEDVILVGYSRGACMISDLAELFPDKIKAAIVYEGLPFEHIKTNEPISGTFPVMFVVNMYSRKRKIIERRQAIRLWEEHHPVEYQIGSGVHWKFFPLGHNWDTKLNPRFGEFIRENQTDKSIQRRF